MSNFGFINATIQLVAIFSYQYFLIPHLLYAVMVMLGLLIVLQTLSAAIVFSGKNIEHKEEKRSPGMTFLVSGLYLVSCFNFSLIGYPVFAVVAATHTVIMMLASFFMWINQ